MYSLASSFVHQSVYKKKCDNFNKLGATHFAKRKRKQVFNLYKKKESLTIWYR